MPSPNQREPFEPLDLTREPPPVARPTPIRSSHDAYVRRLIAEDERRQRQDRARVAGGIDWTACLVPGCVKDPVQVGYFAKVSPPTRREPGMELPLCFDHMAVAYNQAKAGADDPLMVDAVAQVVERREQREAGERDAGKAKWLANKDGDIYYVRLNGLVKVGWTRSLADRLRAYGPNVEVLCHYPATYDDETHLHRQLDPFRAKGREWYRDCAALHDFVARAIAEHGAPTESAAWSEPKDKVKRRKRA